MTQATATPTDELRFRLGGSLYWPGDEAYEDACTLFNSMIEKRPRYVARCAAPDDVIAALAFARDEGLEIAVRAGGHSVTGASLVEDGVVLDIRGMNDVEVDRERRIVRVGGGATWGEVDRATTAHGLATTGGRVSTTGVGGLTLGGGSGWLERKHGLAVDNLLAAELVTAEGDLVRASELENPDLFWALRGGGGNFGVVTAFEFALHPLPSKLLAGLVLHPAERGRELLQLYRDVMDDAPDELGLAFLYLTAPAEGGIPEELHGRPAVAVAGMYAGAVGEGEQALRAIREFGPPAADFFEPQGYADFNCSLDDPPGYRNYWTADQLPAMTDEAIEAIAERSERMQTGASQIFIVAWGGAVRRAPEGSTPLSARDTGYVVHPLLLWEDPAQDEEMIAFGRGYRDVLAPHSSDDVYLNFEGDMTRQRVQAGFGDNHERLAEVKAKWDPDDVFRGNHRVAVKDALRA